MAMTFVAEDGTIRLPLSIQRVLKLKAGDRIELLPFDDGQVLMIAKNGEIASLKGILPKPDLDCSVEEMVELGVKRAILAKK
nr:hypothetical protein [uncultured Duganella sp.]